MLRLSLSKAALLTAFGALQIADIYHQAGARQRRVGGKPLRGPGDGAPGDLLAYPKDRTDGVCLAYMIRWKPRHVAPFVALMGLVVANNSLWAYS